MPSEEEMLKKNCWRRTVEEELLKKNCLKKNAYAFRRTLTYSAARSTGTFNAMTWKYVLRAMYLGVAYFCEMRKQQLGRKSAIELRSVQLDKERIVSHAICPVDHWLARDMPKMNPPAASTAEKAFANSGYAYLRYSPLRNCNRKTRIENARRTQRGIFNYDRCRRQKTVRRLWKQHDAHCIPTPRRCVRRMKVTTAIAQWRVLQKTSASWRESTQRWDATKALYEDIKCYFHFSEFPAFEHA